MAGQQNIVEFYEAIARISGDMLAAARNGDWSRVEALERECAGLILELKLRRAGPLDAQAQTTRVRLLRKVLADDAQIRNIVQPEFRKLDKIVGPAPP